MQNISHNYLNQSISLPQPQSRSSEAHEKDNYTALFQKNVLNEIPLPRGNDSLAQKSVKVGKKKKKKPSAEKEKLAIQMLGDSFTLHNPTPTQASSIKVSLFEQGYCPAFLEEEQKNLSELLVGSAFCENITLYEVFLMEFDALWNEIIDQAGSCDIRVKEKVNEFNSKHLLVPGLYKNYLIISEKINREFESVDIDLESLNSATFPPLINVIGWLNSYADAVPLLINEIKNIQSQKNSEMKNKGIKSDYFESKFKPLYSTLGILTVRVQLFNKCLQSKGMTTLMIQTKTADWSEAECHKNASNSRWAFFSREK